MSTDKTIPVTRQYFDAWNEADTAIRQALLEQCWSDDAVYVDPTVHLTGRKALADHIGKVRSGRPGARLELMSGIDVHHNVLRFLWRLVPRPRPKNFEAVEVSPGQVRFRYRTRRDSPSTKPSTSATAL